MVKFLIKMLIFLVLLICCQITVYPFFEEPFPKFNQMLSSAVQHKMDVVYMADSSAFFVLKEDRDHSNTVEMLQRDLPDVAVSAFMHPAFDLSVYKSIVAYIIKHARCRVIIIPVNLRSFSAHWDRDPRYEFRNEKMVMRYGDNLWFRIFYKPLAVFKVFQPKQKEHHYFNTLVYRGQEIVGRVRDFKYDYEHRTDKEEFFKERFVLLYMYPLSENHRKLRALIEINRLARQHGITALFYITPIDYQKGQEYVGPDFNSQIEANVQLLVQSARAHNIMLLDLSRSLGADSFYWEKDEAALYSPNEHVTDKGRRYIAQQLSRALKGLGREAGRAP